MDAIPAKPSLTDMTSATLFVALELSRSTWLVALHSPVVGKVGQHRLAGGISGAIVAHSSSVRSLG